MPSIKKIIKNYALQVGGLVFTVLFQFFIINSLSVAEYGVFNVIWSSILIVAIFTVLGMDRLLIFKLSKVALSKQAFYYFLSNSILLILSLSSLIILYLYYKYQGYSQLLIICALAIFLLHSLIKINEGVLIANERVTKVNFLVSFVRPCLFVIILAVIVPQFHPVSIIDVFVMQTLVLFLVYAATLPKFIFPAYKKSMRVNKKISYVWMKSAFPFFLIGSSFVFHQNMDVLMINYFIGEVGVAYYSFSSKIVLYAGLGLGLYATMISPIIAKTKIDQSIVDQFTSVYLLLSLVSILVTLIFAAFIIDAFFIGYEESEELIYLFVIILMIKAWFGPVETFMSMMGDSVSASKILIYSTVMNFVLNIILIQYMGVKGAIFATIITMFLWHYLMYRFLLKKYNINMSLFRCLWGNG